MAREEIEIEIDKLGNVTVRTIGIKGERCIEVAEEIVKIIGQEESREMTNEYYEAEQQNQSHIEIKRKH